MNDLKFALRQLRKNPGFTAVAVLTLALGIEANTAIYSLIDAILLKMLPVQRPEELVEIGRNSAMSFSYPIFEQFRDRNQVFSGLLAVSRTLLRSPSTDETEAADGQYVSGNYFSLLGVRAWAGRTITAEDDKISDGGASAVAVISYGLWQRRFGGDPSAVGKQIRVGPRKSHSPSSVWRHPSFSACRSAAHRTSGYLSLRSRCFGLKVRCARPITSG